ncbi:SLAM family member 5-like isoform X2 [Pantherophis guttatus]|uniref:SLAM family member 5-like isoform X2 n=1 Tax=Pantherophis guttatus TaxID=94885 RepID=A0ABM3YR39_PANGU|nr:SLAM family member 5-like isoform X2 [Pantherophis guttatus]
MPVADMSHNRLLRLWFPILLFGTGASGAENGVLGESVTFQVKISTPFEIIFWTKIVGGESRNISVVTFGKPCGLLVPLQDFQKRVNISKDCSKLLLRHLKKDDAGRYSAKIISQNNKVEDVSFELHVYRRLLGSQLRVTCVPDGAGSETWQLHCSTETWEEGTELSWTSATQNMDPTLGNSVTKLIYRDGDLNVTCTARNRVSWASKTVSLKQVCAGETDDLSELPHWAKVFLSIMGSLLLPGSAGFILMIKLRRGGGENALARFLTASWRRQPSEDHIRPH